ncbi:MAG: LysM peptidoglycan-binding domain-containing protein [Thermodesulfobacteriota bacterium]|nr:LysM peptidoglycan-binding domain-containing protein [Thermodesulfobacteriota bacterium]
MTSMILKDLLKFFLLSFIFTTVSCNQVNTIKKFDPALKKEEEQTFTTQKDLSLEEILDIAKDHVILGLSYYQKGNFVEAKNQFDVALDNLHLISLPKSYNKLALIKIGLPEKYKKFDLEIIYDVISRKGSEIPANNDLFDNGIFDNEDSAIVKQTILDENITRKKKIHPVEKTAEKENKISKISLIEGEIRNLAKEFGENNYIIPDIFTRKVDYYINSYLTDQRDFFIGSMQRGEKYLPLIEKIFIKKGLPCDMAYMALVESGFNPRAVSRARAKGLWQLMKGTARRYDLKVNRYIDERYDPVKSTIAASEYLMDLMMIFGSKSFLLGMASYNAGEGKIMRALIKLNDFNKRNFWELVKHGYLKKETNEFVPQIIAAIILAKHPAYFGITEFKPLPKEKYDTVLLESPVSLGLVCKLCAASPSEIFGLNPDLPRIASITPYTPKYQLNVPSGYKNIIEENLEKLDKRKGKTISFPERESKFVAYKVKRGNTLSDIARSFQTSVDNLRYWNKFLNNSEPKAGDIIYIYDLDKGFIQKNHIVKRGDTLWDLGKKYGVNFNYIAMWNGIKKGQLLSLNQPLTIYTKRDKIKLTESYSVDYDSIAGRDKIYYLIKKGDTLSSIAEFFNVEIKEIMIWNKLKRPRIYAGKTLIIYPPQKVEKITRFVKKGGIYIINYL